MEKVKVKVKWKEEHEGTIVVEGKTKEEAEMIAHELDTGEAVEEIMESGNEEYSGVDYNSISLTITED